MYQRIAIAVDKKVLSDQLFLGIRGWTILLRSLWNRLRGGLKSLGSNQHNDSQRKADEPVDPKVPVDDEALVSIVVDAEAEKCTTADSSNGGGRQKEQSQSRDLSHAVAISLHQGALVLGGEVKCEADGVLDAFLEAAKSQPCTVNGLLTISKGIGCGRGLIVVLPVVVVVHNGIDGCQQRVRGLVEIDGEFGHVVKRGKFLEHFSVGREYVLEEVSYAKTA